MINHRNGMQDPTTIRFAWLLDANKAQPQVQKLTFELSCQFDKFKIHNKTKVNDFFSSLELTILRKIKMSKRVNLNMQLHYQTGKKNTSLQQNPPYFIYTW